MTQAGETMSDPVAVAYLHFAMRYFPDGIEEYPARVSEAAATAGFLWWSFIALAGALWLALERSLARASRTVPAGAVVPWTLGHSMLAFAAIGFLGGVLRLSLVLGAAGAPEAFMVEQALLDGALTQDNVAQTAEGLRFQDIALAGLPLVTETGEMSLEAARPRILAAARLLAAYDVGYGAAMLGAGVAALAWIRRQAAAAAAAGHRSPAMSDASMGGLVSIALLGAVLVAIGAAQLAAPRIPAALAALSGGDATAYLSAYLTATGR